MATHYRKGVHPDDFDACVDLIEQWLTAIKAHGATPPKYFTPLNEPDASWKNTPNTVYDHANFARALAERFRAKHPEVQVSGPSSVKS